MEYMKSKSLCPFCNIDPQREIIIDSQSAFSIYDKFPVSQGHALIIPKRHVADYFELFSEEQSYCWELVNKTKQILQKKYNPDGFNVGINVNIEAGQTIPHVHIHLIPRYKGDVKDPEGGVRGVIPEKKAYQIKKTMKKSGIENSIDESENFQKEIPRQAREMSDFIHLVINETLKTLPGILSPTGIRCFRKRCTGVISSEVNLDNNEIHWKCSKCMNNGTITRW